MNPATITEVIELWAPEKTPDGRGGFTAAHTFERLLYAKHRPASGGLAMESEQPVNSYQASFICYYESLYGVTEKYKVKHRDKFYTVRSIDTINRFQGVINVVEQSANITETYQHL